MIAALRHRHFALLWVGQLISVIGDLVLLTALPFYVHQRTGSTLAIGAMFLAQLIPGVVFGSLAGVFFDRWDRKRTTVIADLARAALLLLLLTVQSREWLWVIELVAFLEAVIAQFFGPAKSALLPRLVDDQHLMAANTLNGFSHAVTYLVGPAVGGALLAWLGLPSVVLLDAATFLLSDNRFEASLH